MISQRINWQGVILATIYTVGVLSIAVVAPNALQMLGRKRYKDQNEKYSIKRALNKLIEKGYVSIRTNSGEKVMALTDKGKLKLYEKGGSKNVNNKKWDRKWRFVIYDIKEQRKGTRNRVSLTLKNCGFYRLQDSVWVYPHDCEDVVNLLRLDNLIGRTSVTYAIVDSLEDDRALRKFFGL